MDSRQEVKSLKKALRALTFLNSHGESTVTEVACAIGVPRTTGYRLLETLASEGYVEKQAHSDVYRLTSLVQRLSSGFGDADLVVEVAKPLVRQVGAEIGWPVALATPRGKDMVVRIATDHDTSLVIDRYTIGFTTPMLHAPTGFCYLAHCDAEVRASILEQAKAASETTKASQDEAYLDFMLDQVRTRGYCHIRFAEYREGGLAVPLVVGGRAVGGLLMRYIKSMPRSAKLEEGVFSILRKLAEDISAAYESHVHPASAPGTSLERVGLDGRDEDRGDTTGGDASRDGLTPRHLNSVFRKKSAVSKPPLVLRRLTAYDEVSCRLWL